MPTYGSSGGTSRPARRPSKVTSGTGGGGTLPNPVGKMESGINGTGNPVPTGNLDGMMQKKIKKILMDDMQIQILHNNLRLMETYINSNYLQMLSSDIASGLHESKTEQIHPILKNRQGIVLYKMTKIIFNEDENSYEKLVSVYSAMNSFGGIVAFILQSDGNVTNLYIGTNVSGNAVVAGELLAGNLRGQFPGCEITKISDLERDLLLDSYGMKNSISAAKTIRSLSMIPSRREDERQHDRMFTSQGFEKFIDAMNGRRYTLIIISQSIALDAIESRVRGLEDLYTNLSPYARETASYSESESDTMNFAISSNINSSVSQSLSQTFGTSYTNSVSSGTSTSRGRSSQFFDINFSSSSGWSSGTATSSGSSQGRTTGTTTSDCYGMGDSQSVGTTSGSNSQMTMSRDNKAVQDLMKKLEEHIKRLNSSQTFGMWDSACYVIADDVATASMGTSTLAALFSGDSEAVPRAYYNQWDATNPTERLKVCEYLENLRHPVIHLTLMQEEVDASGKKSLIPLQTEKVTPAMMISGKEIPTLMGLPRKSVPGLVVDHMAEFGRNIPEKWKMKVKRPVHFGKIYHMGQEEKLSTVLDLDTFASHVFICGASGSGKSNTTYNLLQELISNNVPFLVIESAKGEYKVEFAGLPKVHIFTADDSPYRTLHINPFEFNGNIHIREHLDNIIQVISACWPLYGAMPGILKQAFEQVYIRHGWDLEHSEQIIVREGKFPVFKDLLMVLEKIIDESPYSAQAKGDYKGALLNRVSSLCNGFEGQIFGNSIGISDDILFGTNTIIDLSSIGSDETRSIVIGILIIKLRNYRKATTSEPNSRLKHVTVLEEAHNILKRCSKETGAESGNVQGVAVEGLCRSIAEMRSAGEGFMIIDQSPSAVDEAAIKNTAIKIVMRLPAKKDCEEMGAALSLNEEQIRELSRLDIGVGAIFHAGWTDTLLARMGNIWNGRYRLKTKPVLNPYTYIRILGAVVQVAYRDHINHEYGDMVDDTEDILEVLCKGALAIRPLLPEDKRQEIIDAVANYIADNQYYIKMGDFKFLNRTFFDFVIDFLRIESVLRIFALTGVKPRGFDINATPLKKSEIQNVIRWEKSLRGGIAKFLIMPQECEPKMNYQWTKNVCDAEYFWPIYDGILSRYAHRYQMDSRYIDAMEYLHSINFFSK